MTLGGFVTRLSRWVRQPAVYRIGMAVAGTIFVTGLVLSTRALSAESLSFNGLFAVLLIFVGGPATLALNTQAFRLSARAVRCPYSFLDAMRVTVFSSAANFLPLPGGVIIRISALRISGSGYRDSISITAYAGVFWLSIALIAAGTGLAIMTANGNYYSLALLGATLGIGAFFGASSVARGHRLAVSLLSISLATHLVATFRFWLAFSALGFEVSLSETAIIAGSGTAGSVVAVVPGGLGINEAAAALLTNLTGHPAASGFLAATLNRLANYAIRGSLALVFILKARG